MKLLFTEGIGASQTTTNAQDEKIPVYETKTAAENDLANLEVGQIIATKDEGNELSNPVDVVQDGNMHAVTSNAVADALGKWEEVWRYDSDNYILGVKNSLGTWLRIRFSVFRTGNFSNGDVLLVLPQEWCGTSTNRLIVGVETSSVRMNAGLDIESNGNIRIYFQDNTPMMSSVLELTGIYCDVFMNIR